MCVIVGLSAGQSLPFRALENAALNNPHGFGIVALADGELTVFHKFDEKGNDPEVVQRELEKRSKADQRFLHLRYGTRGEKSKEMTHPFTVFNRKGVRRVEFMHNGGLTNSYVKIDQVKSDSRQYAENFLSPLLERFVGDNGAADIEDVFLTELIEQHFGYTNRGLLIANDLDPLFLGKWTTTKSVDGELLPVSNDDYFGSTQSHRMTDFFKPKASDIPRIIHQSAQTHPNQGTHYPLGTAGAENVVKVPAPFNSNTAKTIGTTDTQTEKKLFNRDITPLKEVDLRKVGRFLSPEDFIALWDVTSGDLDDDLIDQISYVSLLEFRNFVDINPDGAARMLEALFGKAADLVKRSEELADENSDLLAKHAKASTLVATLKKQVEELEKVKAA